MKIARSLFLLMPWVLSCAATPPDSSTTRNLQYEKESNRVIVKFKDSKSYNDFKSLDEVKALEKQNAKVFMLSGKQVKEMELREDVVMVVKDHKVYPPKDEEGNPVQLLSESVPYGIDMVNALLVDDSTSSNIGMCVVDSGYDTPHIDLQQTDITGTDGPGAPWDSDSCGHGTHVTGTIMALGGNDEGVVGVVRNGEMPLHVVRVFSGGFDGCSWSWSSDLVGAVQECVDAGSSVVNMSLGSYSYSSFEDSSFSTMADDGLLMIAAAGNGSSSLYSYPASYDAVVSVACIDENQNVAYFSQYNDQVEVAGPGVNTLSTCPNDTYCTKSGTSMASPHVAGVAALVWSAFPSFTNYEVREAMQVTATDLGSPGRDDYYGHGLVNAEALYEYLFALSGPQPSAVPSVSMEPSSSPSPTEFPSETSMPTVSCFDLDIEILPDTWASGETSWTLLDTDGTTVIDSGGFSDFAAYVLYEYTVECIPSVCGIGGSYTWVINDAFGDGLNWSTTDPGYFKVFIDGIELFGSSDGVNFGYSDEVEVVDCYSKHPSFSPTVSVLPTLSAEPSSLPSPSPSSLPTSSPTSEPSVEPTLSAVPSSVPTTASPTSSSMPSSACGSDGFMPIAGTPGAVMLEPLSSSDDGSQLIDLGFDFYWLGGASSTSEVVVATNGQININPGDFNSNCCSADGIGNYSQPRIAIAQEDLDPGDYGDIWVKTLSNDSIVVSFEGVAFFSFTGSINAQATLSSNGAVTICYGEGELSRRKLRTEEELKKKYEGDPDFEPDYHYDYKYNDYNYDYKYGDYSIGQTFAAGIEGGVNDDLFPIGPSVAYPLPGALFDSNGIASTWPTDRCYCFDPVTQDWTAPGEPSEAPSVSVAPTMAPPCMDSTLNTALGSGDWNCTFLADNPTYADNLCGFPAIASHCPVSCGTCPTYGCEDSTLPVEYNGKSRRCSFVAELLNEAQLASACEYEGMYSTCRGLCGLCVDSYVVDFEEAVSNALYLSDSSGLTFSNVYGMDPIAEGYLDNGYFYGTFGSLSVYNGYGSPGTIECPGGAFSLIQLYITPAWENAINYSFTGTKSNGSTVVKTVSLGTTTAAVLYDDFADFTDLVSVYYSALSGLSTHIVFDDMVVEFSSPCTGGSTVVIPPVNDGTAPDAPRG